MSLGDSLGFAALVLTCAGIGVNYLWPSKKWVGYCAFVLAVLCLLWWLYAYLSTKPETVKSTPVIYWRPSPLKQGEALTSAQLNAVAEVNARTVSGDYVYNPTFGTTLSPGAQTLHVIFTPSDAKSYSNREETVTVTVPAPPAKPSEPTVQIDRSIHQSMVAIEGRGRVSHLSVHNNTIGGIPTTSGNGIGLDPTRGPIDHIEISGGHICNLHYWDDLLDCVSLVPGNTSVINFYVQEFRLKLERGMIKSRASSAYKEVCIRDVSAALKTISDNAANETVVIERLRKQRPGCLKIRPDPQ